MSRLDELPPDQRAALSLLITQHKSYAEVAAMLAIPAQAVHDRAHAALAVLAPQLARQLAPGRREEIGDYLLGQQPSAADSQRTRTFLSASPPAREWAQAIAAELAPIAGGSLPELPPAVPGGAAGSAPAAPAGVPPAGGETLAHAAAAAAEAAHTPGAPGTAGAARQPSSRVGGAILLVAIVAAIVVAVVLLTGGGSSKHTGTTSTKAAASAKTTGTSTGPAVTARIIMRSPSRRSRAIGAVDILQESGRRAFYIAAENLPATNGFFYAIWLYSSPSSHEPLSRAPAVGSTHRLEGGSLLPSNAGDFRQILLTREHSSHPSRPGPVVLRGPFTLGG